jgi:hypothetical protein
VGAPERSPSNPTDPEPNLLPAARLKLPMEFHVRLGCMELKGLNGEIAEDEKKKWEVSNISTIS